MADEYKKVIKEKKNEANKLMTSDQVTKCNVAIHGASAAAATASFVTLPGVDAVPITGAQITMVLALGKIFDQKISESVAKGIISAAASTFVGRSLVKLIPVAGWFVSSAVAAGVTEAIGWTVAVDFAKLSAKKSEIESETIEDDIKETTTFSSDDLYSMKDDVVIDDEKDDSDSVESEEKSDDESISNDFENAFGEDE